jgi:ATP-dependent helicase/DNAse subunit B
MAEDNLRLSVYMSIYDKTKEISKELTFYNVDQIPYNTYDNKFKGISKSYMEERFKENSSISLSYSTMKYYFECPFHFYCDNILKLATFESTSATRLGTYSHAVLQDSYNSDFEFSKSTEKNLNEGIKDLEPKDALKDKFYFSQMNEILMDLINYNKRHEELSELKNVLCEEHIIYEEGNLKFHGFIDKLLYAEIDGEIYAAIMDYKTGKDYITLDNVEDGFHLQLPSYMYLLSKSERFKGKRIHIIGIYLQKVNMIALDNNLDKREQREKSFRLQGFTILDPALIIKLDPFYNKSDYIQSMMTTKNGSFGRFAKLLSEEQENDLIELVDVFIHQTRDGIMKAQFDIAPKRIKGNDVSCTFCKYKDICFKKYEDYVFLEEKKFGSEVE